MCVWVCQESANQFFHWLCYRLQRNSEHKVRVTKNKTNDFGLKNVFYRTKGWFTFLFHSRIIPNVSDFEFLSSDQEVSLMCFTMWMSFSAKGFIFQPAGRYLQRDCESSKFRTVMSFWWIVRKGGSNGVINALYIKEQYCGHSNNIIKSHIHPVWSASD